VGVLAVVVVGVFVRVRLRAELLGINDPADTGAGTLRGQ
jgi:hypothetical protein